MLIIAGARFALLEIKSVLAVLVAAFEFAERDIGGTPIATVGGATIRPIVASEPERGAQLPLRVSVAV